MLLTIYDKGGLRRADIAADDSSTQQKEVQGDNVLSLSFTHYGYIALDVNDYTDFGGERYWLTEKYAPSQKNEGEWGYDLKLYGIESLVKRFLVLETTDGDAEPVFTLTATPREHVAMIVKCINDGMNHTADWKVGQVDGAELIVIDYEGKYCDEALKEIAEKVGGKTEWWIEGQTVNVCRCEHGEEITLGYGKGLTSLERDTSNTAKFYTRLFPIGSTRNIDAEKYGSPRLMLPSKNKYVEVGVDEYGVYDHYEEEAFSAIYPRRIGAVSNVRKEDVKDEDGNDFSIYYFKDDTLDFDPNDYELAGETKRVSFQDGDLAGLGQGDEHYFEANYNSKTREFEIITIWPYDDDTQLPGGKLIPKRGDHYILWNIRMPDEYYPAAEAEFQDAVDEYNREHWRDISVYKAPTDHVWIENNNADLHVGRRIRLESDKYFPETGYRSSRITKITRKVNLPGQMDVEISDALQSGALEQVNDSIGALKSYTKSRTEGFALPDIIRSWDHTLPTDNNLFSARRTLKNFVSKLDDDTVYGLLRIVKGLQSADFNSGLSGWALRTSDGKSYLEVDEIWARTRAVLNELQIRKITAAGGAVVVSPASAVIESVAVDGMPEALHESTGLPLYDADGRQLLASSVATAGNRVYVCKIKTTDGDKTIVNEFQSGDLARCQEYNTVTSGSETVVGRSYWRLVIAVGEDWVALSDTDCQQGSDVPRPGDTIVCFGNRTDTARQNLIQMTAYGVDAPAIKLLVRISDYTISTENTPIVISPNGNRFTGEFLSNAGENLLSLIDGRAKVYTPANPPQAKPYKKGDMWTNVTGKWTVGKPGTVTYKEYSYENEILRCVKDATVIVNNVTGETSYSFSIADWTPAGGYASRIEQTAEQLSLSVYALGVDTRNYAQVEREVQYIYEDGITEEKYHQIGSLATDTLTAGDKLYVSFVYSTESSGSSDGKLHLLLQGNGDTVCSIPMTVVVESSFSGVIKDFEIDVDSAFLENGKYEIALQVGESNYLDVKVTGLMIARVQEALFAEAPEQKFVRTGIDVTNRKITLQADTTEFRSNDGKVTVKVFTEDGKIQAELIDADKITAKRVETISDLGRVVVDNGEITLTEKDSNGVEKLKMRITGGKLSSGGSTSLIEFPAFNSFNFLPSESTPDFVNQEFTVLSFNTADGAFAALPAIKLACTAEFVAEPFSQGLVSIRAAIKLDGKVVGSLSRDSSPSAINISGEVDIPAFSSALNAGIHTLSVEVNVWGRGYPVSFGVVSVSPAANTKEGAYITVDYPTDYVEIASDGFRAATAGNKYIAQTADSCEMRFDNFRFMLSKNGIQYSKNGGGNWENL